MGDDDKGPGMGQVADGLPDLLFTSGSTLEVASSKIMYSAFDKRALAIPIFWRWPPEREAPAFPTSEFSPFPVTVQILKVPLLLQPPLSLVICIRVSKEQIFTDGPGKKVYLLGNHGNVLSQFLRLHAVIVFAVHVNMSGCRVTKTH